MQISAALPSMTAAPSNVKKREIHKGGDTRHLKSNHLLQADWPGAFLLCVRSLS